ncbi:MAG: sulfatase-like hydrolase/transferase, partial [Anaerolineae bacterium]|nr:sulfatase-like hydrolase/transferase [Anaerolineae bacterium]
MSERRPNILFIHSDQHRYDCTGPGGHPLVRTPALDRLAREGVWFTHAFTPIPTCCPARQCLLSGKWAEVHGGLWNYDCTLPVRLFNEPTWTETLQRSGYRLGYVGKWHVHPQKTPLDFGFDHYINAQDYFTWRKAKGLPGYEQNLGAQLGLDPLVARWFGGRDPAPVEETKTHWYARQAIALIDRYQAEGRPWHIRLDFEEPHLPCYPAGRFAEMYPPEEIPPWGSFAEEFSAKPYIQQQQLLNWGIEHLTWREWAEYVSRYLGIISQIDDAILQVLQALDERGLAAETIVIYTTDHGDACGGHRMIDKHYIMYEDVVHVPLVIRWPGMI